ncbi:uncharacterized protein [Nicotiana tomentosiformis]|uniref:uncharacterized protein n=1 Tax=Nicotiana tomentosiformis TaxID=4098 RepID=UPI00388CD1A4
MAWVITFGARFDKVVDIARHLEQVQSQGREEREAKRPHGSGGFSSVTSGVQGSSIPGSSNSYFGFRYPIQSPPPLADQSGFQCMEFGHVWRQCPYHFGGPVQQRGLVMTSIMFDGVLGARGVQRGIKVYPKKIEAVQSWPKPSSATEIRSFLCLDRYYRHIVEGFSSIRVPLTRLTQKGAPFRWLEECEESFQKLKTTLTTTPVLVLPLLSVFYTVYVMLLGLMYFGDPSRVLDFSTVQLDGDLTCDMELVAILDRQLSLFECIKARRYDDPYLLVLNNTVQRGGAKKMIIGDDSVLRLWGWISVPNVDGLRKLILEKAHILRYSIHSGCHEDQVKYEHQKPSGLTQRMTKFAHFILVLTTYTSEKLAQTRVQFISHFWRAIQRELGIQVELSITFHRQIDGQSKQTILILEDMLRACVIDIGCHWD